MNDWTMVYKKNLVPTLERLRDLYGGKNEGKIYAQMNVLNSFQREYVSTHPPGECPYPDPVERIRVWDQFLRERQDIEDDSLPVCYLSEFDQGLYAGLVGGEVQFIQNEDSIWISSMVKPFLDDLTMVRTMQRDPNHPWFQAYRRQLRVVQEQAKGKFGVGHFILIDSFNFLYELRGATQAYLDANEQPELVKEVVAFAYHLNGWVMDTFFEEIPLFEGGTFSNVGQWIPGRIVSESVDPFHLASIDYFHQWGKEPVERMFSRYDGGLVHLHSNGRHLLEAVAGIHGVKGILMANDTWNLPSLQLIDQFNASRGDVPLFIPARYEDFVESLRNHSLVGNVFYLVDGVPDVLTANRLMEEVRNYRQ